MTIFDDCIIKTMSSNAESHEEQEGTKQIFVGLMMYKLQDVFQLDVTKNAEKK